MKRKRARHPYNADLAQALNARGRRPSGEMSATALAEHIARMKLYRHECAPDGEDAMTVLNWLIRKARAVTTGRVK